MADRRFGTGMRDSDPEDQPGLVLNDANEVILVEPDGTRTALSALGGAFDGGTIAQPLTIGPITDFSDPLTIEADDGAGFGMELTLDASGTLNLKGLGGSTSRLTINDDQSAEFVRLDSETGITIKNERGASLRVVGLDDTPVFQVSAVSADPNVDVSIPLRMTSRITTQLHAAPADGDLASGEAAIWFDQTNGAAKLMVKAKQADGTVRTGSLDLA